MQDTTVKHLKKLSPTIRIFDIGEKTDGEISDTIEEITGKKLLLVSGKTSQFSKKRNVLIRLEKEQYYDDLINKSPNRILVKY